MATTPQRQSSGSQASYSTGQRLHCEKCGSEIEIITACTCKPPDQVLQCCGEDMTPSTGREVHVSAE